VRVLSKRRTRLLSELSWRLRVVWLRERERERGGGGEMEERTHVRYSALSMQDDHRDRPLKGRPTSAHEDLRYRFELHEDVPWKSIALALFLLAFGSLFLVISHFIYTEHMGGDSSQAYGFLVLGVLLFLPGKQIILMLMTMLLTSCFCFSDFSLFYWSARDSRFACIRIASFSVALEIQISAGEVDF